MRTVHAPLLALLALTLSGCLAEPTRSPDTDETAPSAAPSLAFPVSPTSGTAGFRARGVCHPVGEGNPCLGTGSSMGGEFVVAEQTSLRFTIQWNASRDETRELAVSVTDGKTHRASTTGASPLTLDVENLAPGQYVVGVWLSQRMVGEVEQSVEWTVLPRSE